MRGPCRAIVEWSSTASRPHRAARIVPAGFPLSFAGAIRYRKRYLSAVTRGASTSEIIASEPLAVPARGVQGGDVSFPTHTARLAPAERPGASRHWFDRPRGDGA